MKVVFHKSFLKTYTSDPAAAPGRLDYTLAQIEEEYPLILPSPCSDDDVLLVHFPGHLQNVSMDETVYSMALLAAGASIKASQLAVAGESAFALCRPPGHHASPDDCWGFCYFNNVAIAVEKLISQGKINNAQIIDFDLHYGDGTDNIFAGRSDVSYYHVKGRDNLSFVSNLEEYLENINADLVAVSAGFDRHLKDWGGMLTTEDYGAMGRILGAFAQEKCGGRLFSVLEGGYNSRSLGEAIAAFLEGISSQLF